MVKHKLGRRLIVKKYKASLRAGRHSYPTTTSCVPTVPVLLPGSRQEILILSFTKKNYWLRN